MRQGVSSFHAVVVLTALGLGLWGCGSDDDDQQQARVRDAKMLEQHVADYYQTLKRAYHGTGANLDSLNASMFAKEAYYITYWGQSEPIDSTTKRMRTARPGIKDYENRVEIMTVKVRGDMAYMFFVLRQTYHLNGRPLDEYLPTTFVFERFDDGWKVIHAHRSADLQTV